MNARRAALFLSLTLASIACREPAPPADQAPPAPPAADARVVDAAPVDAARPRASTLALHPGAELTAELRFARGPDRAGPRVLQATLAFPADRLAFVEATPLEATLSAGKQISARAKAGRLRVVILSTANAKAVDSGPLARLRFARVGPGPAVVHLVAEATQLAPKRAGEGLTVGSPWAIGRGEGAIGSQAAPPAPATGPGSASSTAPSSTPSR